MKPAKVGLYDGMVIFIFVSVVTLAKQICLMSARSENNGLKNYAMLLCIAASTSLNKHSLRTTNISMKWEM